MAFDPWDPFAIPNMPEDLQAVPKVLLRNFQALGQIPDFPGSRVVLNASELEFNTHIDAVIVKTKRAYLDRRLGCLTVTKPSPRNIEASSAMGGMRVHVTLLKDTAQQLSFTASWSAPQGSPPLPAVCSHAVERAFQDALEVSVDTAAPGVC